MGRHNTFKYLSAPHKNYLIGGRSLSQSPSNLLFKALEKILKLQFIRVDVSYVAPQVHRIVNVALHREYSSGIVSIFSQGVCPTGHPLGPHISGLCTLSQRFWKGFLKWYDRGGENEITSKRIFKVEVFVSSQNINFPFISRDSRSFSFSSSLFFFFSLFFFLSPSHKDLGVLIIFEEEITSSKTFFQMASIYW
jgi:hypothetical protein